MLQPTIPLDSVSGYPALRSVPNTRRSRRAESSGSRLGAIAAID